MAKANIKKILKTAYEVADAEYSRRRLDRSDQIVTIEKKNLVEAFKDGYFKGVKQLREEGLPKLDDSVFEAAAADAMVKVKAYINRPRTLATMNVDKGDKIVFIQPRAVQAPFTIIKNAGIAKINEQLRASKKRQIAAKGEESFHFKQRIQRLHGEEGGATTGTAQLALALQYIGITSKSGFLESDEAKNLKDLYHLKARYTTTGSKKSNIKIGINEGTNIEIDVKTSALNPAGGAAADWINIAPKLEEAVFKWAETQEFWEQKGSNTPKEDYIQLTEHGFMKLLTDKTFFKKSKTKAPKRKDKDISVDFPGGNKIPRASRKKARTKFQKTSVASEPLFLFAAINKELPQVVAKNMQSPRLVYRTGRFANSTRLADFAMTPQGFPSFGYTYDKTRYQTFEPGGQQGDTERDPRKLIDFSIREIAAKFAVGRFYTRRV